jgi:hypothetical protein
VFVELAHIVQSTYRTEYSLLLSLPKALNFDNESDWYFLDEKIKKSLIFSHIVNVYPFSLPNIEESYSNGKVEDHHLLIKLIKVEYSDDKKTKRERGRSE